MVTRSPRSNDPHDEIPYNPADRAAWLTSRIDSMFGFKRDDDGNLLDYEESPQ